MNERVATASDRSRGAPNGVTSPPPLPPTIPSLVLPVLHKPSQVIIPGPPLIGRNTRSRQMSVWCVIRRLCLLPLRENRPLPLYLTNYMRHLSSSPVEEQGNTCTHTCTHTQRINKAQAWALFSVSNDRCVSKIQPEPLHQATFGIWMSIISTLVNRSSRFLLQVILQGGKSIRLWILSSFLGSFTF